MSAWRSSLEKWLGTIDVSGSCLDVGGKQKPVQGRTKSWNVDNYKIVDLPEFDLNTDRIECLYDNVFCLETLMYCFDPYSAMCSLISNTKKNLYISNPLELYGETKPAGTDMVRLFPNWFYKMLEDDFLVHMALVLPTEKSALLAREIRKNEGYKMSREYASGVLIHAVRK